MTTDQQVISNVFNLCEKLGFMVRPNVYHEGVFFDLGRIDKEGTLLSLVGEGTPEQIALCDKDNIPFVNAYTLEDLLVDMYRDKIYYE